MKNQVRFQRVVPHDLFLPRRHSEKAAGIDLCSGELSFSIHAGETRKVATGWKIAIPDGFVGLVKDRSSMALRGLVTQGGVIDSDYRGEVHVILHNNSSDIQHIAPGDRIAQLVLLLSVPIPIVEVDALDETERGENGFGSTG